jgi:predicted protein tyrosine phosphatase
MFSNWRGKWETRSAGIKPSACHPIEQKDIDWADIIIVMEQEQSDYVRENFKCHPDKVEVLGIKDHIYTRDDPALIAELRITVTPILEEYEKKHMRKAGNCPIAGHGVIGGVVLRFFAVEVMFGFSD